MSSKTTKVTNGKILNYKITAPGYKTIYGSTCVESDLTIQKEMVPATSADGVYTIGDRLGDIASFVCYFNGADPDTQVAQKYAVFLLDAKYRSNTKLSNTFNDGRYASAPYCLPNCYINYDDRTAPMIDTHTSTWSTTCVLNTYEPGAFPGFDVARNAATITLNGTVYQSQLANAYECYYAWYYRIQLDAVDPTVSSYSQFALTPWGFGSGYVWSATRADGNQMMWVVDTSGNVRIMGPGHGPTLDAACGNLPVFEIPVN